jgi:hypothetical protein
MQLPDSTCYSPSVASENAFYSRAELSPIPESPAGSLTGIFREHSRNIQGAFREYSGNVQHSGNVQGRCMEHVHNCLF